jgi:endonuclease/exonuclease/phosphatase family metal-dependent hydrolase
MRIASFNVENLFSRAKVMNQGQGWEEGREILKAYAEFNTIIRKETYTKADKTKLRALIAKLGLEKSDQTDLVILRQNRGRLIKRPRNAPYEIVADGRDDWIGWLELKMGEVREVATENTARVLDVVDADVVGVVEAEDRIALRRFNEQLIKIVGGTVYRHVMLIDGNDDRGIDVGLLTREGYRITSICSHVDDFDDEGRIFSRDCPEYEIKTPSGETIRVLVNHFKSKGYDAFGTANERRKRQASRVRGIYDARRGSGERFIAIIGDLNDTPDSDPLSPLVGNGSDLKDICQHPKYRDDGRPGTYRNGTKSQKIDYLLLSPDLFARVTDGGVERRGVWGGQNGTLWEIFPTIGRAEDAASDHAAIWADIDF